MRCAETALVQARDLDALLDLDTEKVPLMAKEEDTAPAMDVRVVRDMAMDQDADSDLVMGLVVVEEKDGRIMLVYDWQTSAHRCKGRKSNSAPCWLISTEWVVAVC